jgi:hypothetical protein
MVVESKLVRIRTSFYADEEYVWELIDRGAPRYEAVHPVRREALWEMAREARTANRNVERHLSCGKARLWSERRAATSGKADERELSIAQGLRSGASLVAALSFFLSSRHFQLALP